MTAPLTPQREEEIRERLASTLAFRKGDAEALLAELDRLRVELAALPAPVVERGFHDALGNLWPLGHLRAEDEAEILKNTPTIQRTVRISEWTEVTS